MKSTHTVRLRRGAALATFLLISLLIVSTSGAVFSGAASTDGYSATAANVSIDAGQAGSASLAVTDVVPYDRITRCFTVEYTGSAVGDDLDTVVLYANSDYDDVTPNSASAFASVLNLTIREDNAYADLADQAACVATAPGNPNAPTTPTSIYDDTIANFTGSDNNVDYANGEDTSWQPTATGEKRGYQVVITFDGNAGDEFQDAALGTGDAEIPFTLTWEVQSTATGSEK